MIVLFGVFLLTLLVITALAIVRSENLFVAAMLAGIFSLLILQVLVYSMIQLCEDLPSYCFIF